MKKENLIACIIFLAVELLIPGLAGAETLTNDSIVKMQASGWSEGLIIAKIKRSQNNFDLSTDKIDSLRKNGVTDSVIKEMIQLQQIVGTEGPGHPLTTSNSGGTGTHILSPSPSLVNTGPISVSVVNNNVTLPQATFLSRFGEWLFK